MMKCSPDGSGKPTGAAPDLCREKARPQEAFLNVQKTAGALRTCSGQQEQLQKKSYKINEETYKPPQFIFSNFA